MGLADSSGAAAVAKFAAKNASEEPTQSATNADFTVPTGHRVRWQRLLCIVDGFIIAIFVNSRLDTGQQVTNLLVVRRFVNRLAVPCLRVPLALPVLVLTCATWLCQCW